MSRDKPTPGPESLFAASEPAMDAEGLRHSVVDSLAHGMGLDTNSATTRDWYNAVALSLRDRLMKRWLRTQRTYDREDC
ncbi:MAG: hypothetical protein OEQ74_01180, partial [Gammaproteobacteria bacterium]|nr:hypothetical protein [Gammaproteobacteria bacterium]